LLCGANARNVIAKNIITKTAWVMDIEFAKIVAKNGGLILITMILRAFILTHNKVIYRL